MHTSPHLLVWFASRAFGIVAMLGLGATVALGLAMSSRLLSRPGLPARLRRWHEALMLVTLGLIGTHAGLLLFDSYLHPGLAGIAVPFALGYRTAFTGLGVIAAWLSVIFGLSFYVRRRIGARRWRVLHRFTIVAYLLALTHVIGAGFDGLSPWMLGGLTLLTAPIAFAFTLRVVAPRRGGPARQGEPAQRGGSAQRGGPTQRAAADAGIAV